MKHKDTPNYLHGEDPADDRYPMPEHDRDKQKRHRARHERLAHLADGLDDETRERLLKLRDQLNQGE
jgi:hypothetical protein